MTQGRQPAPRRPARPARRAGIHRALVLWGLAMALTSCTGDPGPAGEQPSTPESAGDPSMVASRLEAVAGCAGEYPNNHVADFTWQPADPPGDGQRLVLSYLAGGLDTDAFVQSPILPPDQASYRWIHLNPGTEPRYWRVLTRQGDRWLPSQTATFTGVDCPP